MFYPLEESRRRLLRYVVFSSFILPFILSKKNYFLFQAKRANVHTVILPYENQKDYNELKDFIKEGLTVHFAKTYDDVYKIIFDQQ